MWINKMLDCTEESQPCDSANGTITLVPRSQMLYPPSANALSELLYRPGEVSEACRCRVCLKTGTIPIFSCEDLSYDLNNFTGIVVKADDSYPQHLCTLCRESLVAAIAFRATAQNSDRILKQEGLSRDGVENNEYTIENVNRQCEGDKTDDKYLNGQSSDDGGMYLEYAETMSESDGEACHWTSADNKTTSSVTETIEPDNDELLLLADNIKNNKFYQCEICDMKFRTAEQVEEHCLIHKDVLICEVCKNIVYKYTYQMHLNMHRMYLKQRKKYNKKVRCTICDKLFNKSYLKRHMKMHDSIKSVNCPVCGETLHKHYLKKHLQQIHSKGLLQLENITKIECPVCSRMISETVYKSHMTSHDRRKVYMCEECGKELSTHSSYTTHMLTHKEEYNLKCAFCPYRGKHKGLLRIHVRTHTKDYSYKCATCDARFLTKSNLIAHEKTHSNGVQFVCSECGKCFSRLSTMCQHKISVHDGIKAFNCDLCPKRYGKKDSLVLHKKLKHQVFSDGSNSNSQIS